MNTRYATSPQFPSWEGQGVGDEVRSIFTSATHPQPLPRGEFTVIRSNLLRKISYQHDHREESL